MDNIVQKFFAELIGTFFLASMVLITLIPSAPFPLATAIAAALTLGLCVYFVGGISGCHINPAVALATKAWGWDYLLMPFVGTAIGGLICKALYRGFSKQTS